MDLTSAPLTLSRLPKLAFFTVTSQLPLGHPLTSIMTSICKLVWYLWKHSSLHCTTDVANLQLGNVCSGYCLNTPAHANIRTLDTLATGLGLIKLEVILLGPNTPDNAR